VAQVFGIYNVTGLLGESCASTLACVTGPAGKEIPMLIGEATTRYSE
jgi:hypothetical protein